MAAMKLGLPYRPVLMEGCRVAHLLPAWVAGIDRGPHAAAYRELAADYHPLGATRADGIVQNAINGVFVEDAKGTVSEDVVLERLELQAPLGRQVVNRDRPEIGQAGPGADGRVLWEGDGDLVARILVGPGFNGGQLRTKSPPCMSGSVQR